MSDARLWIVLLALVAFGAGLAAGVLLSEQRQRSGGRGGPLADYQRHFIERFDLPPRDAQLLRVILDEYEAQVQRIKDRHLAQYMSAIEPELSEQGRRFDAHVRDLLRVSGSAAAADFEALLAGAPFAPEPRGR